VLPFNKKTALGILRPISWLLVVQTNYLKSSMSSGQAGLSQVKFTLSAAGSGTLLTSVID